MNLKIRKATKHERKYLLKRCGSEGAFYEDARTIVVDTTRRKTTILLSIIHELCHALGMDEDGAEEFAQKCWELTLKHD